MFPKLLLNYDLLIIRDIIFYLVKTLPILICTSSSPLDLCIKMGHSRHCISWDVHLCFCANHKLWTSASWKLSWCCHCWTHNKLVVSLVARVNFNNFIIKESIGKFVLEGGDITQLAFFDSFIQTTSLFLIEAMTSYLTHGLLNFVSTSPHQKARAVYHAINPSIDIKVFVWPSHPSNSLSKMMTSSFSLNIFCSMKQAHCLYYLDQANHQGHIEHLLLSRFLKTQVPKKDAWVLPLGGVKKQRHK